MGEFNYFDLIAAVIILISTGFAYTRGLVREVTSIIVWLIAAIIAYFAAPGALPIVGSIPVVGDLLAENCQLAVIAGFTVAFAFAWIVLSLIASILVRIAKLPAISALDKGTGMIFGVLRGALVLIVILAANDALFSEGNSPFSISKSQSANLLRGPTDAVMQLIPDDTPDWLEGIYGDAMTVCDNPLTEA